MTLLRCYYDVGTDIVVAVVVVIVVVDLLRC